MDLSNDLLLQLLDKGKATADDQKHAAEFIRWMAQYVPADAAERRKTGAE